MKKRRVFDLDLPEDLPDVPARPAETFPAGKVADPVPEVRSTPPRRGPMAAAVQENAEALRARAGQEASIRAENDALAQELVRLKKLGLVVDLIPIDAIDAGKLVRDRAARPDLELAELKSSIRQLGLSNPIQVESKGDGRYELVQGMRRLTAYRELLAETKDPKFAKIPAGLMAGGETLESLYRRMVDENLVRKDISFAEMGGLARAYAADPNTDCEDADKAVAILFQSAGYSKRSYIRAFAALLERIGDDLLFAQEIPRNLGLDLRRRIEEDPAVVDGIRRDLKGWETRSIEEELDVLRRWVGAGQGEETFPTGKKSSGATPSGSRRAKITFQLGRTEGAAKCTAANGRLEIRLPVDFSTLDRRKLEAAVKLLLDQIQK